uniref:ALOG domain-containing protein n=1 Tax=Ananas comosus var. bracteatus TaxID=296719 RepID=A0A6V7QLM9_ANACO|nr:unnamed protein product [Ananas comosus var. bracteatus]
MVHAGCGGAGLCMNDDYTRTRTVRRRTTAGGAGGGRGASSSAAGGGRGRRRGVFVVVVGAVAEPIRVAEAAGLEHVRAVPEEPPAAAEPGAVQRRARAGVPAVPGPVREDEGAHPGLPLLRPPQPPGPCPCPLRQAWGSLDALVGRLRAAFEENGGRPESNPFGARAVRLYLREVRDHQSKARGVSYEKKKRKKPQQQQLQQQHHHDDQYHPPPPPPPPPPPLAETVF